jgi:glycosyltransferase involved in cell wall biosynthesis
LTFFEKKKNVMEIEENHISVCICTYKRPELLERLLKKIQNQETNELFTYSIIVVDNDQAMSAQRIVADIKKSSSIPIEYYNEPEKNIALTRNKSIQHSKGNFVAFIDDDEFPINKWLLNLYKTCNDFKADVVFGPVKPHFQEKPPRWIIKGKLCERPAYESGTTLQWQNRGTGNVLLKKDVFKNGKNVFNPEFISQGEDGDFFKRLFDREYTFVWCNEATVYETVTPDRWKLSYYLSRALRNGRNSLRYYKNDQSYTQKACIFIKTLVAFITYTSLLPVLFFIQRHIFIKYLIKTFNHTGRLLAFLGIVVVSERNE